MLKLWLAVFAIVCLVVGLVGCVPPYGSTQQQWQTSNWNEAEAGSPQEAYGQPGYGSAQEARYPQQRGTAQQQRDAQDGERYAAEMERYAAEMERRARQQSQQARYPQRQRYPQQARYPQQQRYPQQSRNSGRQWLCKAESAVSSSGDEGEPWKDSTTSALGGGPTRDIAYVNALRNCVELVKTEDSVATIGGNYRSSGMCKVVECQ